MRWLGHRLTEIAILLLIATVLGLAINAVRRDPLPYDLPAATLSTRSGARVVFLSEARRLFEAGAYVFVDTRDEAAFLHEHIEGALSLPASDFAALYPELTVWTGGQPLLLYGASGNLLSADDVAQQLYTAGMRDVRLLAEGIGEWKARGYPIATGSDGLLTPQADEAWDDTEFDMGDAPAPDSTREAE
jgi:rhodanese-related sulfurtransferase